MDPRHFTTATACKAALDALGCHAVERLTGQLEVRALEGGAMWVPGGVVATIPATDLPAWLAPRVQACVCPECGGGGVVDLQGSAWEPCDRGERTCGTCHGAGDALEPVEAPDMDDAALDAGDRAHDAAVDA